MTELTGKQRRKLKALAHHRKPVVMIGKGGITDGLVAAVDAALIDHELIKVKFIDFKDVKKELSLEIAERTGSHLVGIIGNIAILFRQNARVEDQLIVI